MSNKKIDEMKDWVERSQALFTLRTKVVDLLADINIEQAELDILLENEPDSPEIVKKKEHIQDLTNQAKELDTTLNPFRIAEYQGIKETLQAHKASPFFTVNYQPYQKLFEKIRRHPAIITVLSQREKALSDYEKKVDQFLSMLQRGNADSKAITDMESALNKHLNILDDTEFPLLEAIIKAQDRKIPQQPAQLVEMKEEREQVDQAMKQLKFNDDDSDAKIEQTILDTLAPLSVDNSLMYYKLNDKYRQKLEAVAFALTRKKLLSTAALFIIMILIVFGTMYLGNPQ